MFYCYYLKLNVNFLKPKPYVHMLSRCPTNQCRNAESLQNTGLEHDSKGPGELKTLHTVCGAVEGCRDGPTMNRLGGNTKKL